MAETGRAYESLVEAGARALAPRLPERSDGALRAYSRLVVDAVLAAQAEATPARGSSPDAEGGEQRG